jgi:hypothetical protein
VRAQRRSQERLRALFPGADVVAMVLAEPGVLLADLSAGAALMCERHSLPPAELAAYVATQAGLHSLLQCQQQARREQQRQQQQQQDCGAG